MEQKNSLKMILITLGTLFILLFSVVVLAPSLNDLFAVEIKKTEETGLDPLPLPAKPEAVTLTAHYLMEADSKKISGIYIEVYHVGNDEVVYLEIPADTKVNLSEELYKSLQTYAPELPQYLKLSNMAESFSEGYALTGCNRILSELLGVSVTDYVRTGKEAMEAWLAAQQEVPEERNFFKIYTEWLDNSSSNKMLEERWIYYESRQKVQKVQIELAPGDREKDGYVLSGKRTGERLKELLIKGR
ncbi:MAG: hypothetical protein IJ420_09865 [Lachnospiraceae bacterium]|nr:hypothetical protein [Lachnospiraceae bacterium]